MTTSTYGTSHGLEDLAVCEYLRGVCRVGGCKQWIGLSNLHPWGWGVAGGGGGGVMGPPVKLLRMALPYIICT